MNSLRYTGVANTAQPKCSSCCSNTPSLNRNGKRPRARDIEQAEALRAARDDRELGGRCACLLEHLAARKAAEVALSPPLQNVLERVEMHLQQLQTAGKLWKTTPKHTENTFRTLGTQFLRETYSTWTLYATPLRSCPRPTYSELLDSAQQRTTSSS